MHASRVFQLPDSRGPERVRKPDEVHGIFLPYSDHTTDRPTVTVAPDTTHLTNSEYYPGAGLDRCGGGGGDDASASPDITELTALQHFSSILQTAQRRAAEAEGSRRQRARPSHYTGKSEKTVSRQKKALRKLQAQGFHTLPDFFRQKAEEAKQKANMEAILSLREEEEESSGTETVVDKCDSKIISDPDTSQGMLEPIP
jgi:hypothetical protein